MPGYGNWIALHKNHNTDPKAIEKFLTLPTFSSDQLKGDPLSTYSKTRPPAGKKIDFDSNTVKSYRAQLSNLRNDFKRWLRANAPAAKVTGEFDISLNAVALRMNGTALDVITGAPQVASAPTNCSVIQPLLIRPFFDPRR